METKSKPAADPEDTVEATFQTIPQTVTLIIPRGVAATLAARYSHALPRISERRPSGRCNVIFSLALIVLELEKPADRGSICYY